VANQPGDLRARVGVGAGVRYNSPVGPLQADLAYGVTPKSLRLHLTVGFTF
jgi:translocation and assembly module TamA